MGHGGVPTLPGGALPSTSSLDADSMSENVSSLQPSVRADKVPSPPTSGPGFLLTAPQGALKEGQWAPLPPAQAPWPSLSASKVVLGECHRKGFLACLGQKHLETVSLHGEGLGQTSKAGKRRPTTTLHPLSPHQPPQGEPLCGPVPTLGQAWALPDLAHMSCPPPPWPQDLPRGLQAGLSPS